MMRQHHELLGVETRGTGFVEITREVARLVADSGISDGLLTLLIQHTSAGLTITENADPDVVADLTDALAGLAPRDPSLYRHGTEGPDDMPAHIRTLLTNVQLSIPVRGGRPELGTWQGVYVVEHRARGSRRRVAAHVIGT
jgi:secondary thiamine-phosphate synthase enzyme